MCHPPFSFSVPTVIEDVLEQLNQGKRKKCKKEKEQKVNKDNKVKKEKEKDKKDKKAKVGGKAAPGLHSALFQWSCWETTCWEWVGGGSGDTFASLSGCGCRLLVVDVSNKKGGQLIFGGVAAEPSFRADPAPRKGPAKGQIGLVSEQQDGDNSKMGSVKDGEGRRRGRMEVMGRWRSKRGGMAAARWGV